MPSDDRYTVDCPSCGKPMTPQPRRYADGWHDTARCCGRIWDVCCGDEFRQTYRHTAAMHIMPRAVAA